MVRVVIVVVSPAPRASASARRQVQIADLVVPSLATPAFDDVVRILRLDRVVVVVEHGEEIVIVVPTGHCGFVRRETLGCVGGGRRGGAGRGTDNTIFSRLYSLAHTTHIDAMRTQK
jgi:hypothetical protein